MKANRLVGAVLLITMAAMGCSGSPSAQPEAMPSTITATTQPPTTTTTQPPTTTTTQPLTTTTTQPPTTTTTLPPWRTLPDPGMPPGIWHTGSGDLIEIKSMCLEWVLTGTTPPYEKNWERSLTDKLAILGVSVLPEGCDATLRLSMTTSRSSATYGLQRRVCWSGEALKAEASLLINDVLDRSWALADRKSLPPDTIELWECDDEDEPLGPSESERLEWWHTLFSDMFGIGTSLATWIEDSPDDGPACWEGLPTEEGVRALSSLLLSPHFGPTRDWLSQCIPADQAGKEALRPLIPYLIMSDSRDKLETITGETFSSQEDWWSWWEDQQ